MLGGDSSTMLSGSSDVDAAAVASMQEGGEGGGGGGGGGGGSGGSNSGELDDNKGVGIIKGVGDMEGERGFGANRWPRQETLALLKIRSDMGAVFRDSSFKGPLWEEVSRKLAELGYHRSAKKCKEKFENVYKYHKRTKDGRTGKQDKKTYRFFDQLEAFDNNITNHNQPPLSSPTTTAATAAKPLQHQTPPPPLPVVVNSNPPPVSGSISTVPSTAQHVNMSHHQYNIAANNYVHSTQPLSSNNPTVPPNQNTNNTIIPPPPPSSLHHNQIRTQHSTHPTDALSYSTSSSTSSDEELEPGSRRKRKWRDFFEKLMRDVIDKQEAMQKKFMEEIERREHERMVREETWRMQEMGRLNREREILAQERSAAAAKDAALMAFLQKVAEPKNPGAVQSPPPTSTTPLEAEAKAQGQASQQQQQQQPTQSQQLQVQPVSVSVSVPVSMAVAAPVPIAQYHPGTGNVVTDIQRSGNGESSMPAVSSSRWPKVEVQALIKLRTNLDAKYQDNSPKGPLWEEISSAMRKLGYNRSAKRCKEKWENINKYFKKVKESNKKRPEDSKTCPYFQQLDALYKEKNKLENSSSNNNNNIQILSSGKPESSSSMAAPLMVAPEQQWPPMQPPPTRQPDSAMEDVDSENMDQNLEDEDDDEEDDEGDYEIVPNRPSSMGAAMD